MSCRLAPYLNMLSWCLAQLYDSRTILQNHTLFRYSRHLSRLFGVTEGIILGQGEKIYFEANVRQFAD